MILRIRSDFLSCIKILSFIDSIHYLCGGVNKFGEKGSKSYLTMIVQIRSDCELHKSAISF
ncbi:hypothetical protein AMTRI_Chr08g163390 [Amborella trichopoda]